MDEEARRTLARNTRLGGSEVTSTSCRIANCAAAQIEARLKNKSSNCEDKSKVAMISASLGGGKIERSSTKIWPKARAFDLKSKFYIITSKL